LLGSTWVEPLTSHIRKYQDSMKLDGNDKHTSLLRRVKKFYRVEKIGTDKSLGSHTFPETLNNRYPKYKIKPILQNSVEVNLLTFCVI